MNCGAIPDVLVENELFGHKQGDYTGAQTDNVGLSTQAQHGTLFLHKVDTLLPKDKIALLRLLQDRFLSACWCGCGTLRGRTGVCEYADLDKCVQEGSSRAFGKLLKIWVI